MDNELNEMNEFGFWYVWKTPADSPKDLLYIGRIPATSEGWDEMGCDLYPRLFEAELIPDPEQMEAAEADTDQSIALIYHNTYTEGTAIRFTSFQLWATIPEAGC